MKYQIEKLLADTIDYSKTELKGELNGKIMEYCYEHSSKGHDSEFSFVPVDLVYQVAVDTFIIASNYIKDKLINEDSN